MLPSIVLVFVAGVVCPAYTMFLDNTRDAPLPSFCHGQQCPKFTKQETFDDVELRHYEPSVWVSTRTTVMEYTTADNQVLFYKLFNYIAGNNSASMKIDMTTPVLLEIVHGPGPDCESNFTMHFMVPFALQANPPTPTEDGVFIERKDAMDVYVKSYGGFANDTSTRETLISLVDILQRDNRSYQDFVFFRVVYDGPYTFSNRHNEIWVLK